MADTRSYNPSSSGPFFEKPSVTRELTYAADSDDDSSSLGPVKMEKNYHVSIKIHPDNDSDTSTLVSSPQDFKQVSIPVKELASALQHGDEKVQALVKNLVALLENDTPQDLAVRCSRPLSQSSLATFPTYVDNDSHSQSSGSITPAILHRTSTALNATKEHVDHNYEEYYLALRTVSSPATPNEKVHREFVREQANVMEIPISQTTEVIQLHREQEPVVNDLIAPVRPLPIYVPPEREPNPAAWKPRSLHSPSPTVAVEAPVSSHSAGDDVELAGRWWKFSFGPKRSIVEKPIIATVATQPSVVLPTSPTDIEKTIYAQTRRLPLYLFGTMSFLSVSAGMWFFAISSKMFYWFGVFVGIIQIYLIISYIIGYCGKDFNVEEHRKLVDEHSYPSDKIPSVDVYLPCCHEPIEVLENTYKHVAKLQYPNFKVYVLDDGGLDTVRNLATSYGFNYISRDNKPHLKKAGNLRHAFAQTQGEFFAIFDADFCPRHDFLDEILPYMNKYSDIAIVQSPQFFRPCPEQTWVEQGASATQELFYRIVQVNRDRWGASICVGSNAVYRRAALVEVGGTAEIGHSEDVHTGFYALTRGWKLKYIPLALACGVSPDTPRAFFSQQMRWCSGSTTLMTNPEFWKSDLSIVQKVCYMSGMMYYTAAAATAFLASLPGLMMLWLNPGMMMWYNFAYAFPSLIYSIIVFRLWSRQMYNFNVNFVFVIQQYAYLMAVKDRIFGTTASWVPSGDNKSHVKSKKKKGGNNKYRNMRILCGVWMWGCAVALTVGTTLRILEGYHWWNFVPLILLDAFNLFIAHKFIFCSR